MNKNQSNFIRTILYIAGSALIILAMLFIKLPVISKWANQYIWISVFLMYTVCFIPFLLNSFGGVRFDSLLTGGSVYYKGVGVYIAAVIALIYMAASGIVSHSILIIGQLAALFLLAVFIYLSLSSAQHTSNVQSREAKKAAKLNEIKTLMKQVVSVSENLDSSKTAMKKKIEKAAGEIRYLSPSDAQQAVDLEYQIYDLLDEVSYNLEQLNPERENTVMKDLDQIILLCGKRKNVY